MGEGKGCVSVSIISSLCQLPALLTWQTGWVQCVWNLQQESQQASMAHNPCTGSLVSLHHVGHVCPSPALSYYSQACPACAHPTIRPRSQSPWYPISLRKQYAPLQLHIEKQCSRFQLPISAMILLGTWSEVNEGSRTDTHAQ